MTDLMSVPEKERAGRAKPLVEMFAACQVNLNMFAVHAKYKTTNTRNRELVATWGKYYEGSARWGGGILPLHLRGPVGGR